MTLVRVVLEDRTSALIQNIQTAYPELMEDVNRVSQESSSSSSSSSSDDTEYKPPRP